MLKSIRWFSIFFISFLLLTIFDCSSTTIIIRENSPKEKISLRKGDLIKIIVRANPSTGYNWSVENIDTTKVTIIDETYIAKKVEKKIMGSGGNKIYLFKAICSGKSVIELKYIRPFEKVLPPKRELRVDLEIK